MLQMAVDGVVHEEKKTKKSGYYLAKIVKILAPSPTYRNHIADSGGISIIFFSVFLA